MKHLYKMCLGGPSKPMNRRFRTLKICELIDQFLCEVAHWKTPQNSNPEKEQLVHLKMQQQHAFKTPPTRLYVLYLGQNVWTFWGLIILFFQPFLRLICKPETRLGVTPSKCRNLFLKVSRLCYWRPRNERNLYKKLLPTRWCSTFQK